MVRIFCLSKVEKIQSGQNLNINDKQDYSIEQWDDGVVSTPQKIIQNLQILETYQLTEISIGYDFVKDTNKKVYLMFIYRKDIGLLVIKMVPGAVKFHHKSSKDFDLTITTSKLFLNEMNDDLRMSVRCIKNTKIRGLISIEEQKYYENYGKRIDAFIEGNKDLQETAIKNLPFNLPNQTKENVLRQKLSDISTLISLLCDLETGSVTNIQTDQRYNQKVKCLLQNDQKRDGLNSEADKDVATPVCFCGRKRKKFRKTEFTQNDRKTMGNERATNMLEQEQSDNQICAAAADMTFQNNVPTNSETPNLEPQNIYNISTAIVQPPLNTVIMPNQQLNDYNLDEIILPNNYGEATVPTLLNLYPNYLNLNDFYPGWINLQPFQYLLPQQNQNQLFNQPYIPFLLSTNPELNLNSFIETSSLLPNTLNYSIPQSQTYLNSINTSQNQAEINSLNDEKSKEYEKFLRMIAAVTGADIQSDNLLRTESISNDSVIPTNNLHNSVDGVVASENRLTLNLNSVQSINNLIDCTELGANVSSQSTNDVPFTQQQQLDSTIYVPYDISVEQSNPELTTAATNQNEEILNPNETSNNITQDFHSLPSPLPLTIKAPRGRPKVYQDDENRKRARLISSKKYNDKRSQQLSALRKELEEIVAKMSEENEILYEKFETLKKSALTYFEINRSTLFKSDKNVHDRFEHECYKLANRVK